MGRWGDVSQVALMLGGREGLWEEWSWICTPNKERSPLFVSRSCTSSDLLLASMGTGCFSFCPREYSWMLPRAGGKGERLKLLFFLFFFLDRIKIVNYKTLQNPNSCLAAPVFIPSPLPLCQARTQPRARGRRRFCNDVMLRWKMS